MAQELSQSEEIPYSPSAGKPRLSGRMGDTSLALTVLAFSAPIAVVSGFIPFTIIFDGTGAPFAFALTTVLMVLFSVGYVTMTRHVPKPGDFYSFISSGLGRVVGLGSAFLAVLSYLVILAGSYAFIGISTTAFITSLGGSDTPWWVWSIAAWVIVSTLGYFHVELSAKLLSIAMLFEVVVVMIFNIAVLAKGGAEGLTLEPLTPSAFAQGDMSVTLLFAILVFLGFEATALFRDEVREPNTTIPRATYGAVLFVGILYTISCYALIMAYGSTAVDEATNSPATMFADAIGSYVAPAFTQLAYFFVITSMLAALLSIHNVLARYVHNLGVDKALPKYLSKVHDKHRSPYRASTAVAAAVALGMAPFIIAQVDGATLYGRMAGLGSTGVIFLMGLVSLAVIAWFGRNGVPPTANVFKVFIAPLISFLTLMFIVVFAMLHFEYVVGGDPGQNLSLLFVLGGGMVAGFIVALYFRYARPHVYDSLGRADRTFDLEETTG